MKFKKGNYYGKKRPHPKKHSNDFVVEQKTQLASLLAKAKTEEEKTALINAFNISVN